MRVRCEPERKDPRNGPNQPPKDAINIRYSPRFLSPGKSRRPARGTPFVELRHTRCEAPDGEFWDHGSRFFCGALQIAV